MSLAPARISCLMKAPQFLIPREAAGCYYLHSCGTRLDTSQPASR